MSMGAGGLRFFVFGYLLIPFPCLNEASTILKLFLGSSLSPRDSMGVFWAVGWGISENYLIFVPAEILDESKLLMFPLNTLVLFLEDLKPVKCPDHWVPYSGHCYYLHRELRSWSGALSACQKAGGDLASIHNIEEHSFVISQLGYRKYFYVCITYLHSRCLKAAQVHLTATHRFSKYSKYFCCVAFF